ncbi:hypothetical protein GYMLUDRAFT_38399 [Collybiopsis luxurians FD-317 M1]|nr:hypothetical protein GYMLUDRAFT_38399 [Collybiopsis luxurians FD-317 M1]
MPFWSSNRFVQSWVLNAVVLGLGLVSVIAGYQTESPVVVASGATACVGSFMNISFILCRLPHAQAQTSELDERVKDLETQLAQAREEAATIQRNLSESLSNVSESAPSPSSARRRRSLPRPPSSPTSTLLSSSYPISLLKSESDTTSPPQYHTPPSRSADQYFHSTKLRYDFNTDSTYPTSARSTSHDPSLKSKSINFSNDPSATSKRPLPPPSYRSSGRDTPSESLPVFSKTSLPKLDTSVVNDFYPGNLSPSAKPSEASNIPRSLPPPTYSRVDFSSSHTNGALQQDSDTIVKPDQALFTKLDAIPELPNTTDTTTPTPMPSTPVIQDKELSPLRYIPPLDFEDYPRLNPSPLIINQSEITTSESKKHFRIRKHGKTMIKGIREKISGGRNLKSVQVTQADLFLLA